MVIRERLIDSYPHAIFSLHADDNGPSWDVSIDHTIDDDIHDDSNNNDDNDGNDDKIPPLLRGTLMLMSVNKVTTSRTMVLAL
jgi:hypothetical protein